MSAMGGKLTSASASIVLAAFSRLCHVVAGRWALDRFSYFIVFYSLILGLALTELLGGFARMIRARALRKLEPQTALLAVFILLAICSIWIDGWVTLQSITIDFLGLAAPVGLAICFYLASAVVFPDHKEDHERLADYYRERKTFVIGLLLVGVVLTDVTSFKADLHQPAFFWFFVLPYNAALVGSMTALLFVRSPRTNIVLLSALILLITIPYWSAGAIHHLLPQRHDYG
jgi:hypothetical protein